MEKQVASLNLGIGEYRIATILTEDQKARAAENLVSKSYAGTYKFKEKDFFVIVDNKTDMVLALYKRRENVEKEIMKAMVGELMDAFAEPTTMAHDQMIYWVYNKDGKISSEVFNVAKKNGETENLGTIASVKFSSSVTIAPDKKEEIEQKEGKEKMVPTSTIYYIITSDPLVKVFMAENANK